MGSALQFHEKCTRHHHYPHRRGTNDYKENEAERVGQEMAFAALDLFVRIKSLLTAHFRCGHTLAIDNGNTWFRVTTGLAANFST